MFLISIGVHSNPPLKTVQLTVFEFLRFDKNIKLLHPGDSYDLSTGNKYPAEGITLFLVGMPFSKKNYGRRYIRSTKNDSPTPCLFFFIAFNVANSVLSVIIDFSAPKIFFLDT